MRGPDATKLLQDLMTQDISLFNSEPNRAALNTAFLNVKGKVLYEAIIVKPLLANQDYHPEKEGTPQDYANDVEYWLDVDRADLKGIAKMLTKYKLRKKLAKIEDISDIIKVY